MVLAWPVGRLMVHLMALCRRKLMSMVSDRTPAKDLTAFLVMFPEEMAMTDEDPAAILDRYFTADFVQYNDGVPFDRAKLIAHARPSRKNVVDCRVEVHEALTTGDRVAARYTLFAEMRKGPRVGTEIYMFGQLASDGRLSRIDQITREVPESD
ncbi:nuclear transport factor 2 family protein [Kitasatospora sp. NPDC056531]|uniref:nuclear transport factor 2 family protein n=1 Tax=Kitasatospora sp. NPDC056531 TaxID=3345856 RepID=UPI0036BB5C0E